MSYSGQCYDKITNKCKVHPHPTPPHHNHKHQHHHASAQRKQNWLLKIYDLSQFLQCKHKISHFLQQLWEVPQVTQEVGLTSFTKTSHTYHPEEFKSVTYKLLISYTYRINHTYHTKGHFGFWSYVFMSKKIKKLNVFLTAHLHNWF